MSRPRNGEKPRSLRDALLSFLAVALLSTGAALCLCAGLLDKRGAALPVILWCAGTALASTLYGAFVRSRVRFALRAALWTAAGVLLAAWGVMGGGLVHEIVQLARALVIEIAGDGGVMAVYAARARAFLCVFVTLLMSAFASDGEFTPAAVLFLLLTVPVCASFDRDMALRLLPGIAGLLLLLGMSGGRRAAAAVVAVVLALGGLFLLPPSGTTVKPLADAASDIRAFIEDYLMYDDVRASFTLENDGYLPLSSRLGGEANPSDRSVMEVETDRVVRLRATAQDMYSGMMWYDTLSSRRYLYVSPTFASLRDALFDVSLPRDYADAPQMATVKIHMLTDATTTLYAPQRARGIEVAGDRMVLYFNTASELFLTRDLAVGDEYTVRYVPFRVGDAATERLIAACESVSDPHFAEAAEQYLNVPDYMQGEVHALVADAVGESASPYEAALRIEKYLSENYRYDLNVGAPPENVDFMTWFLLGEEKAGYCTYFATAMTLMCRIAGLPARYVTGYLVSPDESGVTLVTGKNAHAWTEVYLNGFGWLSLDATPDHQDDRGDNPRASDSGDSSAPPTATPTPTPTPTPSPTPSPEPPDDQGGAPTPSPTPEPDPDSEPDATPSPEPGAPPNAPNDPDSPDFMWLWLLLPLLIALIVWRYLATEPTRRAARHPADAALIYYAAVRDTLAARRLRRMPDETLMEFAARAETAGLPLPFAPLAAAASCVVYGRAPRFTAEQAASFKALYLACRKELSPFKRAAVAARRMLPRPRRGKMSRRS